ncbi:hypothetical protein PRK78_007241 [Emydomyces testavorans]|uniref:Uncharacterized protein n=1 Tax=Emydomyces testavorans TaxID=2070801 RepID=A0AAF0DPY0_9EURO|nr:hypothetical protein PRK78_007241 [Emydomyces testavorans]
MASIDLSKSFFDKDLVETISHRLRAGGVPNVLWGNYLLTVYGVPEIISDAAFAVPDHKLQIARQILCKANLNVCRDAYCAASNPFTLHPPTYHFHLHRHDLSVSLFKQSEVLPNVPDVESATNIISASDKSLPRPTVGLGNGAFLPRHKSVRVPTPACFTQACLMNFVKYIRKQDPNCPFDLYFLGWVTYMMEYVYPRGYLNIELLSGPFKEFVIGAYLGEETVASCTAARDKLLNSNI